MNRISTVLIQFFLGMKFEINHYLLADNAHDVMSLTLMKQIESKKVRSLSASELLNI